MENDRKNQTTRTKKRKKMLTGVLFVTGLLLCIYPAFASLIDRKHQQNVIQTYQGNIEANSEEKLQEMLGEAERYNEMLWQTNGVLIGDIEQGILEEESYQSQLNLSGTSVMGTLSIPSERDHVKTGDNVNIALCMAGVIVGATLIGTMLAFFYQKRKKNYEEK